VIQTGGFLTENIDIRAVNAISDVVQNRPSALRQFDQIFMRAGDMVLQSAFVARWAKDRRLAFMGDGDAISVAVAYLRAEGIFDYGPSHISVFDFDERIVSSIRCFAEANHIAGLDAHLYNCLEPIPDVGSFDCFYTNPPWGASNGGSSVTVFAQRGMELIDHDGEGLLVIADRNDDHPWTEEVLANVQKFAVGRGFYVSQLTQRLHSYHLDDNPELLSCNLILRSRPGNENTTASQRITDLSRLDSFYRAGGGPPQVRYVLNDPAGDPTAPRFEMYGGTDD
jgi:predicted methyltransferase